MDSDIIGIMARNIHVDNIAQVTHNLLSCKGPLVGCIIARCFSNDIKIIHANIYWKNQPVPKK